MKAIPGKLTARPAGARGFTLVELLLAVLIFGLLAATAYAALDRMAMAGEMHRERAGQLQQLQMAVSRLDMDLRQLTSRAVQAADGALEPALAGGRHDLSASRAGWANPAGLRRSSIQRLAWRVQGDTLLRQTWPVTDRAPATPAHAEPVLHAVERLDLRYQDLGGQWHPQWPAPGLAPTALPRAVEYRLWLTDGRDIRRLLVVH